MFTIQRSDHYLHFNKSLFLYKHFYILFTRFLCLSRIEQLWAPRSAGYSVSEKETIQVKTKIMAPNVVKESGNMPSGLPVDTPRLNTGSKIKRVKSRTQPCPEQ